MKVYIHFDIFDIGAGGNNFLNYFSKFLTKKKLYTLAIWDSDIVLINSHHKYAPNWPSKELRNKVKIIHRLDGLPKLYNEPNDIRQDQSLWFNQIADANIFQSNWCLQEYRKLGLNVKKPNMICHNGTSDTFISLRSIKEHKSKFNIINVSWSDNVNKGRDDFQYLINNIDYSKYNVTHVGPGYGLNLSNYNIKHIRKCDHSVLAQLYKKSDIFFTGAKFECCSNAIIEAQTIGLPTLAINSGSNNELIKNGENGLIYSKQEDIIPYIDIISKNIQNMSKATKVYDIEAVSKRYIKFFEHVLQN